MSLDEAYLDLTCHLESRKYTPATERTFLCRDERFTDSPRHCLCDLSQVILNKGSCSDNLTDSPDMDKSTSEAGKASSRGKKTVLPNETTTGSQDMTEATSSEGGKGSSTVKTINLLDELTNDIDIDVRNETDKNDNCSKDNDISEGEQYEIRKTTPANVCPVCNKEFPPFTAVEFGLSDEEAVREMRTRIEQRTRLTASAGIAPNTMLAKVCSDKNKPNGQYRIPPTRDDVMHFIRDLPTRKVSGVGKVGETMLNAVGVYTCTDLWEKRALLYHLYSNISFHYFMRICLGIGATSVQRDSERKSISTERTFAELNKPEDLYAKCAELCESLAQDMKDEQLKGKTVSIKLKTVKFIVTTRAQTLPRHTSDHDTILHTATELLKTEILGCTPQPLRLRLMGVRMSSLIPENQPDGKQSKQNTITGAFRKILKAKEQEQQNLSDGINNSSNAQESCFSNVAIDKQQDQSTCISEGVKPDMVMRNTGDTPFYRDIVTSLDAGNSSNAQESCFTNVAIDKEQDQSICEGIAQDMVMLNTCDTPFYKDIVTSMDVQNSSNAQESCFSNVAIDKEQDQSIREGIKQDMVMLNTGDTPFYIKDIVTAVNVQKSTIMSVQSNIKNQMQKKTKINADDKEKLKIYGTLSDNGVVVSVDDGKLSGMSVASYRQKKTEITGNASNTEDIENILENDKGIGDNIDNVKLCDHSMSHSDKTILQTLKPISESVTNNVMESAEMSMLKARDQSNIVEMPDPGISTMLESSLYKTVTVGDSVNQVCANAQPLGATPGKLPVKENNHTIKDISTDISKELEKGNILQSELKQENSPSYCRTRSGRVRTPDIPRAKRRRNSSAQTKNIKAETYICPVCCRELVCTGLNEFNEHIDGCLAGETKITNIIQPSFKSDLETMTHRHSAESPLCGNTCTSRCKTDVSTEAGNCVSDKWDEGIVINSVLETAGTNSPIEISVEETEAEQDAAESRDEYSLKTHHELGDRMSTFSESNSRIKINNNDVISISKVEQVSQVETSSDFETVKHIESIHLDSNNENISKAEMENIIPIPMDHSFRNNVAEAESILQKQNFSSDRNNDLNKETIFEDKKNLPHLPMLPDNYFLETMEQPVEVWDEDRNEGHGDNVEDVDKVTAADPYSDITIICDENSNNNTSNLSQSTMTSKDGSTSYNNDECDMPCTSQPENHLDKNPDNDISSIEESISNPHVVNTEQAEVKDESSLLVCPICNIEQRVCSLLAFNDHVDSCLSRGAITEILREQRKREKGNGKRPLSTTKCLSQPAVKRKKTTVTAVKVPSCRSIASFFKEK